jgi:hypothetical protein
MKLLSSKQELNDCLLNIIKDSQETLKIVSPFVDFEDTTNRWWIKQKWNDLIKLLNEKESFLEIYTKPYTKYNKINPVKYIKDNHITMNEDNIMTIRNLHAKIYINDDKALLSSMNLMLSSYNRSIDFGVVTETNEEYREVLDYCNKHVFIYNKKAILNDLSGKNIDAEFKENYYLILNKNEKACIRCNSEENPTYQDRIYIYVGIYVENKGYHLLEQDLMNINRKYNIEIRWSSPKKIHYFTLEKNKYPDTLLIPVINTSRNQMLGILTDIYNCIT